MSSSRIGLLHYSYPPVVGGVEIVLQQQARMFKSLDTSVTIFTGEGNEDATSIPTVIIPELQSLGKSNPDLRSKIAALHEFPPEFQKMTDEIYTKLTDVLSNIDVLIIHNVLNSTLNIPLNAALIRFIKDNPGKKYIAWVHDIALEDHRSLFVFPNPDINKLLYERIPGVKYITISQQLKGTFVDKCGFPTDIVQVIHNGLYISDFMRLRDKTKIIIDDFHLFSRDLVLFMPTKVIPYKNVDKGIHLLSELKRTFKDPLLLISGGKFPHSHNSKNIAYYEQIEQQIESLGLVQNVVLLNEYINNEADSYEVVTDLYRLSDFILYPTQFENFGLPLLEAAVAKTPILCNTLPVFREIDTENIHYFDFDTGQIDDAAEIVTRVVHQNEQAKLFRLVKSQFNLRNIFEKQILPLIES